MNLTAILERLGACDDSPTDALPWARKRKNQRALKSARDECPRGDWLLWVAHKIGVERKSVVLGACAAARCALRFVPAGETRPLRAIEITEAWCRGEATIEQVRQARAAASAYAAAAAAYAAAAAAYAAAAADAAYYAYAAAYAAAAAAAYAAAAADAPDAAYYADAARRRMHRRTADAVRAVVPWNAVREAIARLK